MDKSAPGPWSGWVHGLLGVIIFSGSLPATRLAVQDMDPLLLTFLRASIAGLLAIALLVGFRQKRPRLAQLVSLIIISSGVVLGFPLLTALALQRITSAHSIVFIGLLPLMTALFGVLRGGERPRRAFWIFSLLGSLLVVGFALTQNAAASLSGDLLMLAACLTVQGSRPGVFGGEALILPLMALLLYVGYEAGRLAALAQAEQRRRRRRAGPPYRGERGDE